ncbi:hypothetical protein BGZ63DRAFT_256549 [Mariannaea sp. PMI_226]|nr:hypothetical protein BGZ63DRAFT_256549 [Mariannaea sp. PMI_226]
MQIYLMACTQGPTILLIHVAAVAAERTGRPLTRKSHRENSVPLSAIARIGPAACQPGNVSLSFTCKSFH